MRKQLKHAKKSSWFVFVETKEDWDIARFGTDAEAKEYAEATATAVGGYVLRDHVRDYTVLLEE